MLVGESMKIKVKESDYKSVMARKPYKRKKPVKTSLFFRTLLKLVSKPDLKKTHFKYTEENMDLIKKDEPIFILMNHSSFIDLEIATTIMYPRPLNIVCEADGFIGKDWLMRHIGCIPTHKFHTDVALVKDLLYCTRTLKSSVLMYPEASYSFDGTTPTPLPDSLGKCIKLLRVPVVMITTYGAFQRDPLYNLLQKRDVSVSAKVECLLTIDDISSLSVEEINSKVREKFSFDHFKWQKENGIAISEKFRAEGLESVLYKCPHCLSEGKMVADGEALRCTNCNKEWRLETDGSLSSDGDAYFAHIPEWFKWEREETKKEIEKGEYKMEVPVKIYLQVDSSALYSVGKGNLSQTEDGFHLLSDDGEIDYKTSPLDNYSLSSDIYWYEMGDMISIGDDRRIFYLFPPKEYKVVTKARFATEEFYKKKKLDISKKHP